MSEKSTIARPYAKAVFELALEQRKLAAWSQLLSIGAAVVADERMSKLLTSPHITPQKLGEAVIDIVSQALISGVGREPGKHGSNGASQGSAGQGSTGLDDQGKNFLRTLTANRRLGILPEIAAVYEQLRAESENIIDVTVTSAAPLDERQRGAYTQALKKRLQRDVRLHAEIDPTLLGGAVLRADDLVIDGSLRGRLERLRSELTG